MDLSEFQNVERVVADPIRFKLKLGIGEDVYASIRYGKSVQQLWDIGGVAATGASFAASSSVASSFFGGGWLAALGIGTATTPVGWVIAAGAASAGAYFGVMRLASRYQGSRVRQVPEFINTPIDLLGASLLDLVGTLAIKIASIDGQLEGSERAAIRSYFADEWGYDQDYVEKALELLAENSKSQTLVEVVTVLSEFKRDNPDCNYQAMRRELLNFLREVIEADGAIDEREELALEKVEQLLTAGGKRSLMRTAKSLGSSLRRSLSWIEKPDKTL